MNNNFEKLESLDMKNIESYYDIYDKACMMIVNKTKYKKYLDAFYLFGNLLNDSYINTNGIDEKVLKKLDEYILKISELKINNEEVRQAVMLLLVKGLKHSNMNLSYIAPDILPFLYSYIIDRLYNEYEEVSLIDVNVGLGIIGNGLINESKKSIEYTGLSNDEFEINISKVVFDLCMNEANLLVMDPLDKRLDNYCASVGLIYNYMNQKDNYNLITKYNKLCDYTISLISEDFFSKEEALNFKKEFKGTILGLIILPDDLFMSNKKMNILISAKTTNLTNYDLSILSLPSLNDLKDYSKLTNLTDKLNKWLESISFKNIYNEKEL